MQVKIEGREDVWKTKVIKKTLNPSWNETFDITGVSIRDVLAFQLFDHDASPFSVRLGC
jgi:Ca2+-dependent lipid-binding protein